MIAAVSNKLTERKKACQEMHIASLYLFGSAVRKEDFNEQSDLDFLYSFQTDANGLLLPPYYDYFNFLFKLENITGNRVDLVAEKKIKNKYFLEQVQQERIKIYEQCS